MQKKLYLLILCIFFIFQIDGLLARTNDLKYKYQLAACMIFQNEADFLQEWIEYHKLVGVQHFYLFNNASTDNYKEVLAPYISSGQVELFENNKICNNQQEFAAVQYAAYREGISLSCQRVKWLAIIDADEFLVPLTKDSIPEILADYEYAGGLYANWLCFGTSNVEKIPSDRLMIDMLNHCDNTTENLGKSIVRPERVLTCTDAHRMFYKPPYDHVNTDHKTFDWVSPIADDKLIIFHYYTRDLDHLINIKYPRRKKWVNIKLQTYIEQLEKFNRCQNNTMQRFVPKLKMILNKK